jgi:putative DNA-invertase from lambdoid prophage Rac
VPAVDGAKRAALYLRVSSDEQSYENQRPDVERIASARGWTVVETFAENASAAKARPEFDRMMADAHRGAFDVVIVWALDRFGRSMVGNMAAVLQLDRLGVAVVSVRETWLDAGGPQRSLLLAIFSWVAEQETAHRSARTVAGMVRARAKGARIGRPRVVVDAVKVLELRAAGDSIRTIAQRLHVPRATVARALDRLKRVSPDAPALPREK